MRYLYVIIFVVFIPVAAIAQVDTLGLVWITDIELPSAFFLDLYIEDLDGDGIKEIIVTSENIYIYNGATYELIWTSPVLDGPYKIKFKDLNNDGLLDLAVHKWLFNLGIILFDPHNSQTLWTSPPLDNTFKCYAAGDRNGDGLADVAIVSKEPFTRYNVEDNMDTVWIDIYDGPAYDLSDTVILTFLNYEMHYSNMTFFRSEIPTDVEMLPLGDSLNPTPMILLFNEIEWGYYGNIPEMYDYYGSVIGINATSLNSRYVGEYGKYVSGNSLTLNNTNVYKYYARSILIDDLGLYLTVNETLLSDDSVYQSDHLINENTPGSPIPPRLPFSMRWLVNEEINHFYTHGEVAVAFFYPWPDRYVIRLYEELTGNYIWGQTTYERPTDEVFVLSYPSIFTENKIVFQYDSPNSKYYLIDGTTGLINEVIDYQSGILKIDDANNDTDDEIYVKSSSNRISVWSLELLTGMDENTPKAEIFSLSNYPNPFNSVATIEYGLPVAGRVRIDIYDLLGRAVETLVDEEKPAGRHQAVWDASGHSSGVYFYRIEAGDYVETKKTVYLK